MNITDETHILLRQAGYDTWSWMKGTSPVICFENEAIIGFVHVFADPYDLIAGWRDAQNAALARHTPVLRVSGDKSWNVYSVFLASVPSPTSSQMREIQSIEEDFSMTRKIARGGIRTMADLNHALLPLLPLQNSWPIVSEEDYGERLHTRLADVRSDVVSAFLGEVEPAEIASIMAEESMT